MNSQMEDLKIFVKQQTNYLRELWYASNNDSYVYSPEISLQKKQVNEDELSDLLDWIGNQLDQQRTNKFTATSFSREATQRLKKAGRVIFDLNEEQVNCIESLGIDRSAQAFFQRAREFDPFISFEDIFQASRNVWTGNYLQVLMGLPVELTPSLFAYSMLYPVSDNYLDDPQRSREEKGVFSEYFRNWLEGEGENPQNFVEQDVMDLVRMIEGQYPREHYPQVYAHLLAIHSAQDKSMRIPALPVTPNSVDIVGLTFEKGGTSVLTDGILAAGDLTIERMKIIFNYGAFAQLMDDQEDLTGDLHDKNLTLFTEAALAGKVDRLMNRVFCFAHQVLKGLDKFDHPYSLPLKQTSMKGIDLLLIDAVLRTEKFYSKAYLLELEKHFPFRFEYIKRVRRIIKKKQITAERLTGIFMPSSEPANPVLFDPMKRFFTESPVTFER